MTEQGMSKWVAWQKAEASVREWDAELEKSVKECIGPCEIFEVALVRQLREIAVDRAVAAREALEG